MQHVQDRPIQNVQPALLDITTVQQKLALLVHLSVLNAQEEIIINVQLVLRDIISSLLLMILFVRLLVPIDTIKTLELMYVIFVPLVVQHVQDPTIINVKAVLLDIITVQQKSVLLVQLNVLFAQEEIAISVQLVLRDIIFSLLLMILLVRRHVPTDIIKTLELIHVILV